jgi:RNA methyltransferase, TrmH family
MIITSQSNARIKQIRSLRNRREREQTGLFFIEGIRIVVEAVQSGAQIETLVVAPDLLKSQLGQEIVRQEQERGVPILEVSAEVFKSLSVKEGPQGIGAVVHEHWVPLDEVRLTNDLCWIALDAAQDPGNIGTIMRTSDAVGGTGIMLLGNCADPYDPSALRASMGAVFSQRLVKASFADFAHWKERHHYTVVGTSDSAKLDYREAHYHPPLVLLMGSERQGLSAEQQALCDMMVCIPMVGHSDSLNLSVATGIVLYEIFYQARHR